MERSFLSPLIKTYQTKDNLIDAFDVGETKNNYYFGHFYYVNL